MFKSISAVKSVHARANLTRLALCFVLLFTTPLTIPGAFAVDSIFVQSTLDYNAILISEVDIVFVYEQDAASSFPASKSEWFGGKQAYLEMHGDAVQVVSVFIPQGFDSEMVSLPERRREAIAVYIYGQHDAAGATPAEVSAMDDVLVQIDEFGILVAPR